MKVCLVAPRVAARDVGGVSYVQTVLTGLGNVGAHVDLLVDDRILGAPVCRLSSLSPTSGLLPRRSVRPPVAAEDVTTVSRLLLENEAARGWDIVHAIGTGDSALAAVVAGRLCGLPVVISDLGVDQAPADHVAVVTKRMTKLVLRGADLVVAPSDAAAEGIRTQYQPPGRLEVIEAPLDLQPFRTVAREAASTSLDFHIVTVCSGSIDQAGVDDLLKALEFRPRPETAWHLSIAGPLAEPGASSRHFLEQRLGDQNLAGVVSLVGIVADLGMPNLLLSADAYVDAARDGPHSAVAVAALAVGCPVIAAARRANVALFANDPAVALFGVGDTHGLCQTLHARMTSMTKNLSRRDAVRLADSLSERFSPTAYAGKLIKLYRSLSAAT